jgi:L-histidine N-alpha-methyltransferase
MSEATQVQTGAPSRRMLREVAEGLRRRQKELPPKYFYDARGSLLFDEITRLPEYYLTRMERALLTSFAHGWLAALEAASLVELGAGSGDKTRILLDALPQGSWYVPVDISASYLEAVAAEIGAEYPHLEVVPAPSDISTSLAVPEDLPRPTVLAFLGSTIGNFDPDGAVRLLERVRRAMRPGDRFLMGADLKKDRAALHAAYNDARGITAAFNLNMLRVLNRALGADFDLNAFEHVAFFNEEESRIEMHLAARARQQVHIPHIGRIVIAQGETIRTEISCKYDREMIDRMFTAADLTIEDWVTDADGLYALVTGRSSH